VSPEGTEAERLDLLRFVVANAYDFERDRFGAVGLAAED